MMDLQAIPLEVENGAIVRCGASIVGGEWRLVWLRDGGRRKEAFGDPFPSGMLAARASRKINERADGA
jgi:hypothetical protein